MFINCVLQGSDLTRGSRLIDIEVWVGDGVCDVTQMTDNEIACKPPADKPDKADSQDVCSEEKRRVLVRHLSNYIIVVKLLV